ncbi:peptidoglycan DD-metalloendopeptidase family protein [Myxococcota bacterium]|nr:peptidoglycan DD-metalloendopeptidase family protein [Myxococcota bacterium]
MSSCTHSGFQPLFLLAALASACGEGALESGSSADDADGAFLFGETGGDGTGGSGLDLEQDALTFGDPGGTGATGHDTGDGGDTPPGPPETDFDGGAGGSTPPPVTDPDAALPPPPDPDAAAPPPPPPDPLADCPRIRVVNTGGIGLNVRPDPSTNGAPLGNLPDGSVANVLAIVQGQDVDGNATWYEVERGGLRGFVAGTWAQCIGPAMPGERDDVFLLPFGCGESFVVTQGNNSPFSHNGRGAWAYDFSMGLGTPMRSVKPGTVVHAYAGTQPGHPCYDGGGPECINDANYVVVAHPDGSQTLYAHLNAVHVGVGAEISQGQHIGDSGSTGWSTGPHAHVERQEACGRAFCNSIPMGFADVPGDGMPVEGQTVTSENGCGG